MESTDIRVGLNAAGKADFLVQSTQGETGRKTLIRRFAKAASFNWLPLSRYTLGQSGRCVIAGVKDHPVIRDLARERGPAREINALGPGAYAIRRVQGAKGDCLLLVGGDLAASLSA